MPDMHLTINVESPTAVFASFTCPCGCHPGTRLAKGEALATEGCCCGTQFAIGHDAAGHVIDQQYVARPGFSLVVQPVTTPWGPTIAAFAVGQDFSGCPCDNAPLAPDVVPAHDPVCGMPVDAANAAESTLVERHDGRDFFFCSTGCRDLFRANPTGILDPARAQRMP